MRLPRSEVQAELPAAPAPVNTPSNPAPSGVVVVDKPEGPTSFQVVAQARRVFGTRRIGHAGTLDPMATGVLLLLVGEAAKLSEYLTGQNKAYEATIEFGVETDTLDRQGSVVAQRTISPGELTRQRVEFALQQELTRTEQVPPSYSALKVEGRRAYALSRSGQEVQLAPRAVRLHAAQILEFSGVLLRLAIKSSKGYYVRALARDLGAALGVPAHLSALRRTESGPFSLDDACAWPPESPPPLLDCAAAARAALPCVTLTDAGVLFARQGKKLQREDFTTPPPETMGAWLNAEGALVALGYRDETGFRVKRGFTEVVR